MEPRSLVTPGQIYREVARERQHQMIATIARRATPMRAVPKLRRVGERPQRALGHVQDVTQGQHAGGKAPEV